MDTPIREAQGTTGKISLFPHVIRIQRKGFSNFLIHGLKGDKEIAVAQITSVQFKKPGTFTSGYIQFAYIGSQESKGGIYDAVQDENTVVFIPKQMPQFEALKAKIDEMRFAPAAKASPTSNLDDLEKLASLRDKGIITHADFDAKKRQILGI
jgi:hypothetical protein